MTKGGCLKEAAKSQLRFAAVAGLLAVGYVIFLVSQPFFAKVEADMFPVLAANGDWPAAVQTSAFCHNGDAYVSGAMSKVRTARYEAGRQSFYLWNDSGLSRRIYFVSPDDFMADGEVRPTSRAVGVQEWGPWRLRAACKQHKFTSWYSVVYHRPWHGLWSLKTIMGPFPLPIPMPN